jgi:predicted O-methyltransferase YrrM
MDPSLTALTDHLATHGFHDLEGNSHQIPPQTHALYYLSKSPVVSVLEIGFNAGHSSNTFLQHPTTRVTSLDLGCRPYVSVAKTWIDDRYPGRHTLVLGDSTSTLPQLIETNPHTTFDLIFIDGGHDEATARSDLENCLRLAHDQTLLLMDDVVYTDGWQAEHTVDPTKVWREYIQKGRIQEFSHYDYCPGRGMSWGKIKLPVLPVNDTPPGADGSRTQSEQEAVTSSRSECPGL